MGQGKEQDHALDLGQSAHAKLLQSPIAAVGIDALGGCGAVLIDRLGLVGPHARAPRRHGRTVLRLGLVRIDRLVLGRRHRPIHRGVRAGLFDLLVTHETAIDQPGLGRLTATLAHLLDHRHHLTLITSRRGHLDAYDHQRIDVAGQLRVVRGPKPAVAHLHDRRLGIGRRGARLIGGLTLATLDRFELGQARQRLGHTGLALAGRA